MEKILFELYDLADKYGANVHLNYFGETGYYYCKYSEPHGGYKIKKSAETLELAIGNVILRVKKEKEI